MLSLKQLTEIAVSDFDCPGIHLGLEERHDMGWATGDKERVDNAKVSSSRVRIAGSALKARLGELRRDIESIQHDEKRKALVDQLEQAEAFTQKAYDQTYEIDLHLNR